jgi:Kef-type K+ transport system membrane component KefB
LNIHHGENVLVSVLIQLIVILVAARLAGNAARFVGQPRAVGEIVAGLLLGPSFLGWVLPDFSHAIFTADATVPMQIISQIGLILLMFQIGSEFDFSVVGHKFSMVGLVLASVGVPVVVGFSLAWVGQSVLAPNINPVLFAGFVAVAFSITAVPILGRILREYNLQKHPLGVLAISIAAANDILGWLMLAAVSTLATAQFSSVQFGLSVFGVVGLVILLFYVGPPFATALFKKWPVNNATLHPSLMVVVLVFIFVCGICTQKLGLFTIFGGFLCGVIFHKHHAFVEAWQRHIGTFVLVFFLPVFFTYSGLRTQILGLVSLEDWLWCLAILLAAIFAKIIPVYGAARATGNDHNHAIILGVLMNTRALMELIVLNVGFSLGLMPQKVFTMLVIMAIVTTILTGPFLRIFLPRIGVAVNATRDA